MPKDTPFYNIVLLGQTQAGKSTFLQATRRYVDPSCQIELDAVGNGNLSHTHEVMSTSVTTKFPEDTLFNEVTCNKITLETLRENCKKKSEYRSRIDQTKDVKTLRSREHDHPECTLQLFDTPGLEDTSQQDEVNVVKILTRLSTEGSVHLILIMVALQSPLTPSFQETLKTYRNIFGEMLGLIAFVHTKVQYESHFFDRQLADCMQQKRSILDGIMGMTMEHFMIDCDLEEDRPIRIHLRQDIIRTILLKATCNEPVSLSTVRFYKTPKMKDVDSVVSRNFQEELQVLQAQSLSMIEAARLTFEISDTKHQISTLKLILQEKDTDTLEIIDQLSFEENWAWFGFRSSQQLATKDLKIHIHKIQMSLKGATVEETSGGFGTDYWTLRVKRHAFSSCQVHGKVYAFRRNVYRRDVSMTKTRLLVLEDRKEFLDKKLKTMKEYDLSEAGILNIKMKKCREMIRRTSTMTLPLPLFQSIVNAGVYRDDAPECLSRVRAFYENYRDETSASELDMEP